MSASISVFNDLDEVYFESAFVYGRPASSTRAELYGVIMELSFSKQSNKTLDRLSFLGITPPP